MNRAASRSASRRARRLPHVAGAALALACLAACHTKPVSESTPAPPATPTEPPESPPAVAIPPLEVPVEVPPACVCEEAAKVHHRPPAKPKPKPPAPTPVATPPVVTAPPPGTPINAQVGELSTTVMSILGKKVQGPKNEDLGRVVDVLAEPDGRVRAAIIDFGGFLGVGTRRIAVDWPLLRFDPANTDKPVILDVTREKLQSVPEFKDSGRPRILMPPAATTAPAAAPSSAVAPSTAAPSSAPAATNSPSHDAARQQPAAASSAQPK